MSTSVFISRGDGFEATELARGPWDPNAQHGGAPAALLARAFERLSEPDLAIARLTYDFLRPVPLGPLRVQASVAKPGRRVQLLEGTLVAPDGTELVRGRALQVRTIDADVPTQGPAPPPPPPEEGQTDEFEPSVRPMFSTDTMEIRFVRGRFIEPGPATAWFRLRYPLLDEEDPTPLQRLAAAADFGNGISTSLSWEEYLFINGDLTIYLERQPVGEWICLESDTRVAPGGIGVSESVLYDERGRVGRAGQALLVAKR